MRSKILATLSIVFVSLQLFAQSTEWAVTNTLLLKDATSSFYIKRPPFLFNPSNGRLLVQTDSASTSTVYRTNTTAYAASLVIKASTGTLVTVFGYNSKATTQFIQLHDSASLPSDTAVPAIVIAVPAYSNFSLEVTSTGIPFTSGITVCNSSTGPTKTIGSADCWFTAVFK